MSKSIHIGNQIIGGNNPVLVQSMTNTKTEDVVATVNQINNLHKAFGDNVILNDFSLEVKKGEFKESYLKLGFKKKLLIFIDQYIPSIANFFRNKRRWIGWMIR